MQISHQRKQENPDKPVMSTTSNRTNARVHQKEQEKLEGLLHKEEVDFRRAIHASLKEAKNYPQKKQEKSDKPVKKTVTRSNHTNARVHQKEQEKLEGLLHKEEVELQRALNASLRDVQISHQTKQENPDKPVISTRSNRTNARVHHKEQEKLKGLLHKEEVELRKALHASLKETINAHKKKQEMTDKPVITRSVCTSTNTTFRIKSTLSKKSENTDKQKGDHTGKKTKSTKESERGESGLSQEGSQGLIKPLKRKDVGEIAVGSFKKKKRVHEGRESEAPPQSTNTSTKPLKSKGGEETAESREVGSKKSLKEEVGKAIAMKKLKSPTKRHKVTQLSRGMELKILPKNKHKSLNNRKMSGSQKSKAVQSLSEKFSATVKDGKQPATERKKDTEGQIKKIKSALESKDKIEKSELNAAPSEETSNPDKICELRRQVSNSLQGKVRRKLKCKLKNRRLVSPLGEIYIPANIAKTEDFLTFLCLRGKLVEGSESVPVPMY